MLVFLGNTEDNFTTFYGNFFFPMESLSSYEDWKNIFFTMVKNHFVLLLIFEENFKSHDNTMNENWKPILSTVKRQYFPFSLFFYEYLNAL